MIFEHIILLRSNNMTRHEDVHCVETFRVRLVAGEEIHHHRRLPKPAEPIITMKKGSRAAGVLLVCGCACRIEIPVRGAGALTESQSGTYLLSLNFL